MQGLAYFFVFFKRKGQGVWFFLEDIFGCIFWDKTALLRSKRPFETIKNGQKKRKKTS